MAKIAFASLDEWYQTPLGQSVSQAILSQLSPFAKGAPRLSALQLGLCAERQWLSGLGVLHAYYLSQDDPRFADLLSRYSYLPFRDHSFDCVFLPHTLAFVSDPFMCLKEMDRILAPNGHLILVGFNPNSLYGLQRLFSFTDKAPASIHCPSLFKTRMFLSEMGYHLIDAESFFYRPLWPGVWQERFDFLETLGHLSSAVPGSLYFLIAEKRVATLTHVKPLLKFKNIVIGRRLEIGTTRSFFEKK